MMHLPYWIVKAFADDASFSGNAALRGRSVMDASDRLDIPGDA